MSAEIQPGLYQHYKGNQYIVIGVARDCEDPDNMKVVYQATHDHEEFGPNQIWLRDVDDFLANVEVDGQVVPRFKFIGDTPASI